MGILSIDLIIVIILAGITAVIISCEIKIWKPAREAAEQEKIKVFKAAQEKYFKALSVLKAEPTSSDLKQRALSNGREFAEATRRFQGTAGMTLFDEVALMNDINAACAGANTAPPSVVETSNFYTIEDRLVKLSELKQKGLLKEQEYEERRREIINEI